MNTPDARKGYRLLKEGEIVLITDEWFNNGSWKNDGSGVGQKWTDANWLPFRRRIEDCWIPLSERLPVAPDEFPIWIYFAEWKREETGGFKEPMLVYEGFAHWDSVQCWKPAIVPDPPEPEVPPSDIAFNAFYDVTLANLGVSPRDNARMAWIAALEYARGKKLP